MATFMDLLQAYQAAERQHLTQEHQTKETEAKAETLEREVAELKRYITTLEQAEQERLALLGTVQQEASSCAVKAQDLKQNASSLRNVLAFTDKSLKEQLDLEKQNCQEMDEEISKSKMTFIDKAKTHMQTVKLEETDVTLVEGIPVPEVCRERVVEEEKRAAQLEHELRKVDVELESLTNEVEAFQKRPSKRPRLELHETEEGLTRALEEAKRELEDATKEHDEKRAQQQAMTTDGQES